MTEPRPSDLHRDDGVVLRVDDLTCEIASPSGAVNLVEDVSFDLRRGQTLGIVGESGSGKTMLVRSIMGINPRNSRVRGRVELNGTDLLALSPKERSRHLGAGIAMIFQNPMTSLNPMVPIGRQITEGMRRHLGIDRRRARERAIELLAQVGISEPTARFAQYPHELSGGMRQRVTIAIALASDPDVLIADEATTALDVTVQRQILALLAQIQVERNMSIIMISHDLAITNGLTSEVAVMYGGQFVEHGPTRSVFDRHCHRYTEGLLEALPSLADPPHSPFGTIPGMPPPPGTLPVGCRFAPRCRYADEECRQRTPQWSAVPDVERHAFRCHHPVAPPDAGGPDVTVCGEVPEGRR